MKKLKINSKCEGSEFYYPIEGIKNIYISGNDDSKPLEDSDGCCVNCYDSAPDFKKLVTKLKEIGVNISGKDIIDDNEEGSMYLISIPKYCIEMI